MLSSHVKRSLLLWLHIKWLLLQQKWNGWHSLCPHKIEHCMTTWSWPLLLLKVFHLFIALTHEILVISYREILNLYAPMLYPLFMCYWQFTNIFSQHVNDVIYSNIAFTGWDIMYGTVPILEKLNWMKISIDDLDLNFRKLFQCCHHFSTFSASFLSDQILACSRVRKWEIIWRFIFNIEWA